MTDDRGDADVPGTGRDEEDERGEEDGSGTGRGEEDGPGADRGAEDGRREEGRDAPSGELASRCDSAAGPGGDSEQLSPAGAFSILANGTRVEILQALWAHRGGPASFSELYAGLDVDRGNFNYHLRELTDHFVRRTDRGYELREAGRRVARAVRAGTITATPAVGPTELDRSCPDCGAALEVAYADQLLTLRCPDCPAVPGEDAPRGAWTHHAVPPAVLEGRGGSAALEAARVRFETAVRSMARGLCPECGGGVTPAVHVCDRHDTDSRGACTDCGSVPDVRVAFTCETCGFERWSRPWLPVLFTPPVVHFAYERRRHRRLLDLRRQFWPAPTPPDGIEQRVVSRAPLRIVVTVSVGSDTIDVTVDESLDPVEIE